MRIPAAKIYFPEEDRKKILEQVAEIPESGQLTLGKYTREFEEQFAKYVGTKYAVAVNSSDHNLFLIEDAVHAHGSTLNGKLAGTFVDADGQQVISRILESIVRNL